MGFPIELFEKSEIDEEYICLICTEVLQEPMMFVSCGHIFCSDCIKKRLKTSKTCPACHRSVDDNDLRPPFKFLTNKLGALKIKCINCLEYCELELFYEHRQSHKAEDDVIEARKHKKPKVDYCIGFDEDEKQEVIDKANEMIIKYVTKKDISNAIIKFLNTKYELILIQVNDSTLEISHLDNNCKQISFSFGLIKFVICVKDKFIKNAKAEIKYNSQNCDPSFKDFALSAVKKIFKDIKDDNERRTAQEELYEELKQKYSGYWVVYTVRNSVSSPTYTSKFKHITIQYGNIEIQITHIGKTRKLTNNMKITS